MLASSRDWLTQTFASERAHGVLAPWVLHTGLGPTHAGSGFMTQVIGVAVQEGGMPIPRGGGARLVDALVRLIEDHGGSCETGRDVERVLVRDGQGDGVRLADGEEVAAEPSGDRERHADAALRAAARQAREERGRRFRYGRSEMQIHFALSEPPRWEGDERLGQTAIVHLTPGLDGVSRAVNEAERGPAAGRGDRRRRPAADDGPERAPDGAGLLWIQLQELPWHVKGDAAGELDAGDGTWTEELRERYADRIQARIARHVPNLESLAPQAGDALAGRPAGGEREPPPRRPVLGRARARPEPALAPAPGEPGPRDAGRRLWHIGASTHPGRGSARAPGRWSRSGCSRGGCGR